MQKKKSPNTIPDNQRQKLIRWSVRLGLALATVIAVWGLAFFLMDLDLKTDFRPGVTFSAPYATQLGLDPQTTLDATLDELGVRYFRIPAYWSMVEPNRGAWDWSLLDGQLDSIAQRNGKVTLAIGQKLPRWPECWIPEWALNLSESEREIALKDYLTQTVSRYKNHPAVEMWQVENEAHFAFGICPKYSTDLLDREIALVRSLDSTKPIATTDSGELSWWTVGRKVDRLGTSVYRVVVGPTGIFSYWFVPPQIYLRKAQILGWLWGIKDVYVSELQMEPWVKDTIPNSTREEQAKTMDLERFKKNAAFAKRMGLERIDFWGVEWWYWLKTTQQQPEYWEQAKTLFNGK